MMETDMPVRFFLGANTPAGFVGYLDDLYDCRDGWRAYLIKSGPGSGKSTLIRTVMQHMVRLGYDAEAILCSSDPQSLRRHRSPHYRTPLLGRGGTDRQPVRLLRRLAAL